jgi:hypothetical protein
MTQDSTMSKEKSGRVFATSQQKLLSSLAWKKRNPDQVRAMRAAYYLKNRDRDRSASQAWRRLNPDRVAANRAKWEEANPWIWDHKAKQRRSPRGLEKARAYYAERYSTDPSYVMRCRFRASLRQALRLYQGGRKTTSVQTLLGCTMDALCAHLEAQFQPGMSWANRSAWHIDHIRPCASFDLTDPVQQRECFSYKNLRPLWARDNQSLTWSARRARAARVARERSIEDMSIG